MTEILETIDGALRDYEASGDAMRWVPPEKRTPRPEPRAAQFREGLIPVGDGDGWTYIGATSDGVNLERREVLPAARDFAEIGRGLTRLGQRLAEAIPAMLAPLQKFSAALAKINHMQQPGSHGHCRTCHPEQAPRPLAVNGHEYARRRKARARRKRG